MAFVQRVEGVEEFDLRLLASGEKLHIVQDQHVELGENGS